MKVTKRKIAELLPDPDNARTHGKKNRDAIRASLELHGQVEPLVVQKGTGRVIGGNGRLDVMREIGWTEVDVVEVEADDAKAKAIGLALNRTGDLAGWDREMLDRLITDVATEHSDDELGRLIESVGMSQKELDRIVVREHERLNSLQHGETSETFCDEEEDLTYSVIVDLKTEQAQVELLKRLEEEGFSCRMIIA